MSQQALLGSRPESRPLTHHACATSKSPVLMDAPWPFTPSREWAKGVRCLMRAAQGLPVIGWEASWRLSPGQSCFDRLLLGFATKGVAASRLQGLARSLGMPCALAQGFEQELPLARRVLLSAELGERAVDSSCAQVARRGAELKAYLEFDHAAGHGAAGLAPDADWPAGLAMRGRKWRADPSQPSPGAVISRTSDYWRQSLQARDILALLGQAARENPAMRPAHTLVCAALELALWRQPKGWACDFLTVTESPTGRSSYCIRMHDSGLKMDELTPALAALLRAWQLPSALCARIPNQRRLSWLAAGVDGAGFPFLTLYAEARLADARLALAFGASYDHD